MAFPASILISVICMIDSQGENTGIIQKTPSKLVFVYSFNVVGNRLLKTYTLSIKDKLASICAHKELWVRQCLGIFKWLCYTCLISPIFFNLQVTNDGSSEQQTHNQEGVVLVKLNCKFVRIKLYDSISMNSWLFQTHLKDRRQDRRLHVGISGSLTLLSLRLEYCYTVHIIRILIVSLII